MCSRADKINQPETRMSEEMNFVDEVTGMSIVELRSRVLCQRDYLRRFYRCLDGLPIPKDIPQLFDECRDPRIIRSIVEALIERAKTQPTAESTKGETI